MALYKFRVIIIIISNHITGNTSPFVWRELHTGMGHSTPFMD